MSLFVRGLLIAGVALSTTVRTEPVEVPAHLLSGPRQAQSERKGEPRVQRILLTSTQQSWEALSALPSLQCPSSKAKPKAPTKNDKPSTKPTPELDPLEAPEPEQIKEALLESTDQSSTDKAQTPEPSSNQAAALIAALNQKLSTQTVRVGLWGDSHMAAAFFSETLRGLLGANTSVATGAYAANFNRVGIRTDLRKSCLTQGWQYEGGHIANSHKSDLAHSVGLMNLQTNKAHSWVSLDLRDKESDPRARPIAAQLGKRVQLLYQSSPTLTVLNISINGQDPQTVSLAPAARTKPSVLELVSNTAIAQLKVELTLGSWRWHGVLREQAASNVQLDVFAYPGATAEAWTKPDAAYFNAWFNSPDLAQLQYDWAIFAYGTNEGNDPRFDAVRYKVMLHAGLTRFRQALPQAACTLIGPPDRGVLVRKSSKKTRITQVVKGKKKVSTTATPISNTQKTESPQLLRYSHIHAQIADIQAQIAQEFGCTTWRMQESMGGVASAYRWARQSPALMARDLIHLTPAGYQELGRRFAVEHGWIGQGTR